MTYSGDGDDLVILATEEGITYTIIRMYRKYICTKLQHCRIKYMYKYQMSDQSLIYMKKRLRMELL